VDSILRCLSKCHVRAWFVHASCRLAFFNGQSGLPLLLVSVSIVVYLLSVDREDLEPSSSQWKMRLSTFCRIDGDSETSLEVTLAISPDDISSCGFELVRSTGDGQRQRAKRQPNGRISLGSIGRGSPELARMAVHRDQVIASRREKRQRSTVVLREGKIFGSRRVFLAF
jgi:hypothetical protein